MLFIIAILCCCHFWFYIYPENIYVTFWFAAFNQHWIIWFNFNLYQFKHINYLPLPPHSLPDLLPPDLIQERSIDLMKALNKKSNGRFYFPLPDFLQERPIVLMEALNKKSNGRFYILLSRHHNFAAFKLQIPTPQTMHRRHNWKRYATFPLFYFKINLRIYLCSYVAVT